MMACLASAFNVEYVDIEEAIAEVASVVGERPQLVHTRPGQPWVGLTTGCAVHIAHDDRTRGRIRQDTRVASSRGVSSTVMSISPKGDRPTIV